MNMWDINLLPHPVLALLKESVVFKLGKINKRVMIRGLIW
jgi:hypothetical protein